MELGLTFEVVWSDEHLVELRVHADNGRFAATAECYEAVDCLASLADAMRGFPRSREDRRELTIGATDPAWPGHVRLTLRCIDGSGHCVADVDVHATDGLVRHAPARAAFSVPIEPAAVDAFVAALRRAPATDGTSVRLPMAT
jgi:hypothetical protein